MAEEKCGENAEAAASAAEDILLMRKAAAGDDTAFSAIVRKHEASLFNFFARSGIETDAEDLVQLTFLKLNRCRQKYRPTAKFTTFLYLLARQVMVDHLRSCQRRERLVEKASKGVTDIVPAPTSRGERFDAAAALDTLTPQLRDTIVLVIIQGLPYAEAAEILKVPIGTIKSRVHTALSNLRQFYER